MKHVTDARTDRPIDRSLHEWLSDSVEQLPNGAELPPTLRSDVLRRLPSTPQRPRWWPFEWIPARFGATRSAEREGPRPQGGPRTMFSASRIVAGSAVLTLAGSLAFVAVPTQEPAGILPSAPMEDIDPTAFGGFVGRMVCRQGSLGTTHLTEWGSWVEGETYPACAVEVGDPRFAGNIYSVHDYYKYDGRPNWGVRNVSAVLTNDEGHWVSTSNWGYQQPEDGAMAYAMQWRGEGAYEGLSALTLATQEKMSLILDMNGVIFPGELPKAPETPLEAALAVD